MNMLDRYEALDRALVRAGWHPTTQWWFDQLDRFLGASVLRWVVRSGRRAGKSTTMCRLACAVALSDHWRASIPPGDRAVIAFVSVDRKEASLRLYTIASILRALGVPFDERGEEIELRDRPVVFRVVTCSISGTVGFTSIAVFADEVARWEAGADAANPAADVLASLRPTLAGIDGAIEVCVSSPWGTDDEHARLFDLGNDDDQVVSWAPTWVARPSLTEAKTKKLESNPIKHQREYGAIPGSLEEAAFASEDVHAAFARPVDAAPDAERIMCIDASRLRNDDFAWAIVSLDTEGLPVVVEVGGMSPPATTDDALAEIAAVAKRHHVRRIFGDDYDSDGNKRYLAPLGFAVEFLPWTAPGKSNAGALLRRLLAERQIAICEHATLKSQLLTQRAKLRPSNNQVDYPTNGRDYIACLFVLCGAIVREQFSIDVRPSNTPTGAQYDAAARELASVADSIGNEFGGPENDTAVIRDEEHRIAEAHARAMAQRYPAPPAPSDDDTIDQRDLAKYYQRRLREGGNGSKR